MCYSSLSLAWGFRPFESCRVHKAIKNDGGYSSTVRTPGCGPGDSGSIPDSHPNKNSRPVRAVIFVWVATWVESPKMIIQVKQ